jgi:hypothetical protein
MMSQMIAIHSLVKFRENPSKIQIPGSETFIPCVAEAYGPAQLANSETEGGKVCLAQSSCLINTLTAALKFVCLNMPKEAKKEGKPKYVPKHCSNLPKLPLMPPFPSAGLLSPRTCSMPT